MVLKLLLVVGVFFMLLQWRRKLRLAAERGRAAARGRVADPVDMLACAECGVHVPRSDAVTLDGPAGPVYCCIAHRIAHRAHDRGAAGR